jgi:hypothetical protein
MILPFQENKLSDNEFIRVFSQMTDSGEFMWHRDGRVGSTNTVIFGVVKLILDTGN